MTTSCVCARVFVCVCVCARACTPYTVVCRLLCACNVCDGDVMSTACVPVCCRCIPVHRSALYAYYLLYAYYTCRKPSPPPYLPASPQQSPFPPTPYHRSLTHPPQTVMEEGLARDGTVAQSEAQSQAIWRVREVRGAPCVADLLDVSLLEGVMWGYAIRC